MKKLFPLLLLSGFLLSSGLCRAQSNVGDSAMNIPMLYAAYTHQWPGGDMKDRFGNNSNINGGFLFKHKSNWIFGADYNYLFGNKIKGGDSLFSAIDTPDGYIIDRNGELTNALIWERGYFISAKFGKIFPVISPNPNSGPMLMASIGFMQHKIRIDVPGNTAPQLEGEYLKGYDKLTNGLGISEFIGYMYMGNQRLVSFFGGVEFTQAFTQSRRSYDFNLGARDNTKRLDLLWGVKVGWIIPFYKRVPKGYYYN